MDEHRRSSEHHPARTGRGFGPAWRIGAAVLGCALGLAVVATSAMGLSLAPRADLSPTTAPDEARKAIAAVSTRARVVSVADASSTELERVFAVLERAERAASESGRTTTLQIEQAAAELGMLLSSYLADHPDVAAGVEAARRTAFSARTADAATGGTAPGADITDDEALPAVQGVSPDALENEEVTFSDVWAATLRLAALLDPVQSPDVPTTAVEDASTPLTDSLREVVARWGHSTDGYLNGYIPADVLCELDFAPGHLLRCDAAAQLDDLNAAYRAQFGTDIPMTDSYRPYDVQVRLKAQKGWLAATPGHSKHGWGLAADLGSPINTGDSAPYLWLRLHGPDYGWDNPSWARLDGSKPEPWHFEFFAAGPIPNRALSEADVQLAQADRADSHSEPAPDQATPTVPPTTTLGPTQPSPPTDPVTDTTAPTPSPSEPSEPSDDPSPPDEPSPTVSDPDAAVPTPPSSESAPEPSDPAPEPTPTDPATVTVPDVTGFTADDALIALEALGFVHVSVSEQPVPSDTVAVGFVATTTPTAGSSESLDADIVLVLSSGPEPAPVPAPTGDDSAIAPSSMQTSLSRRAARRLL